MGLFPALPLELPPVFAIMSPVPSMHPEVDYAKDFAITAVLSLHTALYSAAL